MTSGATSTFFYLLRSLFGILTNILCAWEEMGTAGEQDGAAPCAGWVGGVGEAAASAGSTWPADSVVRVVLWSGVVDVYAGVLLARTVVGNHPSGLCLEHAHGRQLGAQAGLALLQLLIEAHVLGGVRRRGRARRLHLHGGAGGGRRRAPGAHVGARTKAKPWDG